ncbi:hypothetical protein MMC25_001320 [Agyrium rufum]|nr:hypothetical protein [Agyrium rufum]
MSVVQKLNERYLWVDSLCLLQDDMDELQACVSIMDLFYEMAMLTIVAALDDAWSGIPGIMPTPRSLLASEPMVKKIKQGLSMTTYMDMDVTLRRCVYSSRAWTMQEGILSTRLLFFVDGQAFFKCAQGLVSERLNPPGRELQLIDAIGSVYFIIFAEHGDRFKDYSTFLMYYTSRKLTYQSDILRAAQGMLQKFTRLSGLHCFEGLASPLDRSLLFERQSAPISHDFGRREGFPSYSWTGWKHASVYNPSIDTVKAVLKNGVVNEEASNSSGILRAWIIWYCRLDDGKSYRIDDTGRLRKSLLPTIEDGQSKSAQSLRQIPVSVSDAEFGVTWTNSYSPLLFWTVCVNLRIESERVREYPENNKDIADLMIYDKYGESCGTGSADTLSFHSGQMKFALIAAIGQRFWALMLEWTDGIAKRRGIAGLSKDVLNGCLSPGPRWRAIVLG